MAVILIFAINWDKLKINIEEVIITTDCIILITSCQTLSRFVKHTGQKLLLFCVYKSVMNEQHQVNMTRRWTSKSWVMSIYLTNSLKIPHISLLLSVTMLTESPRKHSLLYKTAIVPNYTRDKRHWQHKQRKHFNNINNINALSFIVIALTKRSNFW